MKAKIKSKAPGLCGVTTSGQFVGDICPGLNYWKCRECRLLITAASPPEVCPSCRVKCHFADVTCYAPECGGFGSLDRRLL
jgi:rubrerythrin